MLYARLKYGAMNYLRKAHQKLVKKAVICAMQLIKVSQKFSPNYKYSK